MALAMTKMLNGMKRSTSFRALALILLMAAVVYSNSERTAQQEHEAEIAWNQSFESQYGSNLPDFYALGDGTFQARWLTQEEESSHDCTVSEHCVFLKVATNQECPTGGQIRFRVLDSKRKVLEVENSDSFLMRHGDMAIIELGSKNLTESGFIEPIDAFCADRLPAV